jgi:hypothetical protein
MEPILYFLSLEVQAVAVVAPRTLAEHPVAVAVVRS